VLGALISDPEAIDRVSELQPEWFYWASHQAIAEVVLKLIREKTPVDVVTVSSALTTSGKIPDPVTPDLPLVLANTTGITSNVSHYVSVVKNAWALRQARMAAARFATDPDKTDAELEIATLGRDLSAIECGRSSRIVSVGDVMGEMTSQLEAEAAKKPGTEIISTGYDALDRVILGFEPGIFQLYAARPGVGKSALATGFAVNLGRASVPAAVFWQEDTSRMFALRVAAAEGNIPVPELRHGTRMSRNSWAQLVTAANTVSRWPLYIESTKGLTMPQVTQRMRRLSREKGVRVFLFDHLGKVKLDDSERHDLALGSAAGLFLEEADRLHACPVAFHQLSKKAEDTDGTPSLGWIFNSDVLAQHARVVGFLNRNDLAFEVNLVKATYGQSNQTVMLGWNPECMTVFNPRVVPVVKAVQAVGRGGGTYDDDEE
jgi:replicative DNA helicase